MTFNLPAILFGGGAALLALYLFGRSWLVRRRSRARIFESLPEAAPGPVAAAEDEPGFLARWLGLAGFRRPGAVAAFVGSTLLLIAVGLAGALLIYLTGTVRRGVAVLGLVPGGIGDLFLPAVYGFPWILFAVLSALPWLYVRSARKKRVEAVEQDLPVTLELLASLAEAGIGFDAALDRILSSQPAERPLAVELRAFQIELLAGRPRVQCLRRLARRLEVSSLTVFVSALVQAAQVGAGIADVLRRQAEDLRHRRRERALQIASALPVKLLVPLVACFMPGLAVAMLGPTFYEFFKFVDNLLRNRGLLR